MFNNNFNSSIVSALSVFEIQTKPLRRGKNDLVTRFHEQPTGKLPSKRLALREHRITKNTLKGTRQFQ